MKFFTITSLIICLSGAEAFQLQSTPPRSSLPLFAWINVEESAPRDIQSMEAWAAACGVQKSEGFQLTSTSQDLIISEDGGLDVSVMTTQDLPAGTPVLFVPQATILSSSQAILEMGSIEALEKLKGSALRHVYLMLKILLEYEKGDQSPWFPWLNSLPRYYSNGASMTSFCYSCLPPLVRSLAMTDRAKLSNFRGILKEIPFLSEETRNNKELSRWAFQVAYTRSFEANDGSGNLCIAPMADMFNHGSLETEIAISYDEQGNCYAHTTRDVAAGSPLRMSYGDPTNPSFLFARYGFLDETSPATFCKIMISTTDHPQVVDLGYAHNRMLFYKDTGEVSQEVWDVLLYQTLDPASQQEFYQAHMRGDLPTQQAFHQQYWAHTASKLQNHVDTFLQQLDQLSAKTQGKELMEHPRLPVILRHNEFVKTAFLAVRARYFQQ